MDAGTGRAEDEIRALPAPVNWEMRGVSEVFKGKCMINSSSLTKLLIIKKNIKCNSYIINRHMGLHFERKLNLFMTVKDVIRNQSQRPTGAKPSTRQTPSRRSPS